MRLRLRVNRPSTCGTRVALAVLLCMAYFGDTGGGGAIDANKLFDNSFVERANKSVKV